MKLPLDFTPLGAAGNSLYISLDVGPFVMPFTSGRGRAALAVPNDSRLKGLSLYLQGIIHDSKANQLNFVFSNGAKMKIG